MTTRKPAEHDAERVNKENEMPRFCIQFRHFARWDGDTPLMYIPMQQSFVEAETAGAARATFFENMRAAGTDIDEIRHVTVEPEPW